MQFDQQSRQPDGVDQFTNALGWLTLISRVLAVTVEVFLHGRFGARYLGVQAALGLVALMLFTGALPREDPRPMFIYTCVYLLLVLAARSDAIRRERQGDAEHSYYTGWPHLCRLLRGLDESYVKRLVEPGLVSAAAVYIHPINLPLGTYLFWAAIGLFISANLTDYWQQQRVRALNDSVIEQRQIAERFLRGHAGFVM